MKIDNLEIFQMLALGFICLWIIKEEWKRLGRRDKSNA